MKTNSLDQRRVAYDLGEDRYYDLLQQAEQYRFEQRATQTSGSASRKSAKLGKSPIAYLLLWTKSLIAG